MRRRSLLLAAALPLPALAPGQAGAQGGAYPNRPVRLIIPWPPGQATDLMARVTAQRISEQWGQSIVPENRAGAGGMIGTDFVAKAAPDGYTVLAASTGPITTAPLVQRTPYDVERAFTPIAMIAISPYVLIVRKDFPAQTAEAFVARLKAEPGKYTYATSGTGAAAHLISLMFLSKAGLDAVHVPFQGSAPGLTAVAAGQVDFAIETLVATGSLFRQGNVRALGVSLANGTELAPELMPLARLPGLQGYDIGAFGGFMVPAATPREVVDRLAAETERALAAPEVTQRLATIGMQPSPRNAAGFREFLQRHREDFRAVIEANNIRVDG
jgi:tripartite-type tricarboxylate transporter receptor subunit TctC